MSVMKIVDYASEHKNFIKGVVTATGVGFILLGVKNFIDAKRIREEREAPIDREDEFEEYLAEMDYRLYKKQKCKVSGGVCKVVTGAIVTALGILSFTPARNIVIESDAYSKIKEADIKKLIHDAAIQKKLRELKLAEKIADADLAQKIKDIDLAQKIKDADIAQKIKDVDLAQKFKDIDLAEKIRGIFG